MGFELMDSLNDTTWDVVIAGTGVQESLLALALSRSGKQVLHVDENGYYGGAEAALNLQDIEVWVHSLEKGSNASRIFRHASIIRPPSEDISSTDRASLMSSPRAYSIALEPQLIFARSRLLKTLVSARVDQQLEFLAAGLWWVHESRPSSQDHAVNCSIWRVPMGREDIFADHKLDMRVKRSLMKFLRFVSSLETSLQTLAEYASLPITDFLSTEFGLPSQVQQSLLALSLSSEKLEQTMTSYALPRIATYLRSMNELGPGFGAVIPKWGGLAEVAQVSCRAGAVGGGVYALSNSLTKVVSRQTNMPLDSEVDIAPDIIISLGTGETVKTRHLVGSLDSIPTGLASIDPTSDPHLISRSVSIVSTPLASLFPSPPEGAPRSAVATVRMCSDQSHPTQCVNKDLAALPVYLMIHSSDTGECPIGQCVIYASIMLPSDRGYTVLENAVNHLLAIQNDGNFPIILWRLQYEQSFPSFTNGHAKSLNGSIGENISIFEPKSFDLYFEDSILDSVETVWRRILGPEASGFMQFERREGEAYDEDYYT